jgi:hypothetical protein
MAVFVKKSGAPTGEIRISGPGGTFVIDDGSNSSITTTNPVAVALLDEVVFLQRSSAGQTYVPPVLKSPLEVVQGSYPIGSVLTLTSNGWEGKPSSGGGGSVTAAEKPTIVSLSQTNPWGLKIGGMIPTPKYSSDSFYPTDYDSNWDWDFWKLRIDKVVDEYRCNGMKVAHDPRNVLSGVQDEAQFHSRVTQIAEYAASRGLWLYAALTGNHNKIGGDTSRPTLAAELAVIGRWLDQVKDLPFVGVDFLNEINGWQHQRIGDNGYVAATQPDSLSLQWIDAGVALVKEKTNFPVSISLFMQSDAQIADFSTNGWMHSLVSRGCDFIDIHPYTIQGSGNKLFTLGQFGSVLNQFPVPVVFGEAGLFSDLTSNEFENFIASMRETAEAFSRVPMVMFYPQDAVDPTTGPEPRRSEIREHIRGLAKSENGFGVSTQPIGSASLTTSLSSIGTVIVSSEVPTPRLSRLWRVKGTAVNGVNVGDSITVQGVNASDVLIGTGSRLATATAVAVGSAGITTTPDSSSHTRNGTLLGDTVITTGSGGKFGEALDFNDGWVTVPQIYPWDNLFWMEAWIKPEAGMTAGFPHIMGQWKNGAASNGDAICTVLFTPSTNQVGIWLLGTNNEFRAASSPTSSVSNGVWSHILAGRDPDGVISIYVNGTRYTNGDNGPGHAPDGVTPFSVGNVSNGGSDTQFRGLIDGVRIRSNTATPGTNFTVPTSPASSDSATELLLQFNTVSTGSGINSVEVATPWLPAPYSGLLAVKGRARNATGARGTVQLDLETRLV